MKLKFADGTAYSIVEDTFAESCYSDRCTTQAVLDDSEEVDIVTLSNAMTSDNLATVELVTDDGDTVLTLTGYESGSANRRIVNNATRINIILTKDR